MKIIRKNSADFALNIGALNPVFRRMPMSVPDAYACLRVLRRQRTLATGMAAVSMLTASAGAAAAAAADDGSSKSPTPVEQSSNEALMKKLQAMEQRIKVLEGQRKQKQPTGAGGPAKPAASVAVSNDPKLRAEAQTVAKEPAAAERKPILGMLDSPVPSLIIGVYGELKFG